MISGLVLAAGHSRRLGQAKALLVHEGEPLLTRVVRTLHQASVTSVVVVVGSQSPLGSLVSRGAAEEALAGYAARIVVGHPDESSLASLRAGLVHVPLDSGVLLWPVDHPFADAALVRTLTSASAPERIVVPAHRGRRGHPVLFGATVASELRSSSLPEGARTVVRRDEGRITAVACADARVCEDIDTKDDARRLLGLTL